MLFGADNGGPARRQLASRSSLRFRPCGQIRSPSAKSYSLNPCAMDASAVNFDLHTVDARTKLHVVMFVAGHDEEESA